VHPSNAFLSQLFFKVPFCYRAYRKAKTLLLTKKPSLFFTLYYTLPKSKDSHVIGVFHDLIDEKQPENSSRDILQKKRDFATRANAIIVPSENTKKDFACFYPEHVSKVTVIHHGTNVPFWQSQRESKLESTRPYFMQVGGRLGHKNFERLLDAFSLSGLFDTHDLLCVGESFSDSEKERIERAGLTHFIRLAEKVSDERLRTLYHYSTGLIYPSLYEGFGIPPLEAMAAGCPVAASQVSSIPEVCGDAVLYFDPLDTSDIAKKMIQLKENSLRSQLIEKGKKRANLFSWQETASKAIQIIRQVG
jgi:glycosyltransferase involved in cell wall biosynthesis